MVQAARAGGRVIPSCSRWWAPAAMRRLHQRFGLPERAPVSAGGRAAERRSGPRSAEQPVRRRMDASTGARSRSLSTMIWDATVFAVDYL
jgi:hypothetical protein